MKIKLDFTSLFGGNDEKNLWIVILLIIGASNYGCATTSWQLGEVKKRAVFDLSCDVGQITVKEIGGGSYMASGCGKASTYMAGTWCGGIHARSGCHMALERVFKPEE